MLHVGEALVSIVLGFCEALVNSGKALIYRGEVLVDVVLHVGEALVGIVLGFCEALVNVGFGFCEALVSIVFGFCEALVNIVFGFSRILHNNFSEVAESQIKRGNLIRDCLKMSVDNQMLTLQLVAQVSHGDDAVLRTAWCGGGLGHGHWLYHS